MKLNRFPQNLKRVMAENHLTQKQLAIELATTQQTISRWLKGFCEPDFDTLLRIAFLYDETPNDLLGVDEIDEAEYIVYEQTDEIKQRALDASIIDSYTDNGEDDGNNKNDN